MIKTKKLSVLSFFSFILFALGCSTSDRGTTQQLTTEVNKLILISFDGFRFDYLSKTETPHFDELVSNGVSSEGLIPVFPSKTFPNYYSMATGLYPENTGFVGNFMLDPETGNKFSMSDRDAVENPDWYGGEPIWNTAEKQGVKAGTMFWVGSEAPIQGMRPTHWMKFEGSMPDSARIDTVMSWLTAEDENEVDFATLYFSFVDSEGHRHGPDSPQVVDAIQRADQLLGYLQNQLGLANLDESTNIIIVADHGMAELSRERVILLDELISMTDLQIVEGSPALMANVEEGKMDEVYANLKKNEEHFITYKKEELPERFHLKGHPRVPELILIADVGYTITTTEQIENRPDFPSGGTHGYDNLEKEMHGIFIAHGPDFKSGFKSPAFESIHLYELMAHLLNIEPAKNDGDKKVTADFMK